MIKKHWFEVWGDEQAQNSILKLFLLLFTVLLVCTTSALTYLSLRPPTIIEISPRKTSLVSTKKSNLKYIEDETIRTLKTYLLSRHNWTPSTIKEQAQFASKYVLKKDLKKFIRSNKAQIKMATKKNISQSFYIKKSFLDLDKKTMKITADRILNISGITTAKTLKFELKYDYGKRSINNPEGIYITHEKLLTDKTY